MKQRRRERINGWRQIKLCIFFFFWLIRTHTNALTQTHVAAFRMNIQRKKNKNSSNNIQAFCSSFRYKFMLLLCIQYAYYDNCCCSYRWCAIVPNEDDEEKSIKLSMEITITITIIWNENQRSKETVALLLFFLHCAG